MSKRLEAMRANPQAGWRISDVEQVCRQPVYIRDLVRFIDELNA